MQFALVSTVAPLCGVWMEREHVCLYILALKWTDGRSRVYPPHA